MARKERSVILHPSDTMKELSLPTHSTFFSAQFLSIILPSSVPHHHITFRGKNINIKCSNPGRKASFLPSSVMLLSNLIPLSLTFFLQKWKRRKLNSAHACGKPGKVKTNWKSYYSAFMLCYLGRNNFFFTTQFYMEFLKLYSNRRADGIYS